MTSHTTIGVVAFAGVCASRRLSHCALLRRGGLWAALQQCGRGSGLRFSLQAHHNSSSSTVESCNAPRKLALSAFWCLSRDEESHVDAILDTPVVDFYNEIMLTYPNAKVILTGVALFSHQEGCVQPLTSTPIRAVRDIKGWMRSRYKFYTHYSHGCHNWLAPWRRGSNIVYGTECPSPEQACLPSRERRAAQRLRVIRFGAKAFSSKKKRSLWQALKRYLQHNRNVYDAVPSDRLLVMDIAGGDGWEKLCPFIGRPVPSNLTFPSRH